MLYVLIIVGIASCAYASDNRLLAAYLRNLDHIEHTVPLWELMMAEEAIEGRVRYLATKEDLSDIPTEELQLARYYYKKKKREDDDHWFDEHCCCIVCGLAVTSACPLACGIGAVLGFAQGSMMLASEGVLKAVSIACLPISACAGLAFSEQCQPDHAAIDESIDRFEFELARRRNH